MKSRRSFMKTGAAALAGASLTTMVPLDVLAEIKKKVAANGKIGVGAIGINGMGWADLTSILKIPEVTPVALCDVDDNVLNYRKYDLARNGMKVETYSDYRKLLENKDVDIVIIGTPDHWHCLQMSDACAAGK